MYFDTHAHLTLCDHIPLAEHIALLRKSGVKKVIDPGLAVSDFANRWEKLKEYPEVLLGIAIAPHYITHKKDYTNDLEELASCLKINQKSKRIVALAEIGLDYFHVTDEIDREKQREIFYLQLLLAKKYDLPVFLHIRDAFEDALKVVKKSGHQKGVLHCFTGSQLIADKFLEEGFFISFSGIVTFKKSLELQAIAKKIPMIKMLSETDAPYLAPVPYRGKKNCSYYLVKTNEFLANLKGISLGDFNQQLWFNASQVIGVD